MAATGVAVLPASAAEPTAGWTASVGSSGSTRYFDAATGSDGSVVLAGRDQSGSETGGIVRELNTSGNEVWKRKIGATGAADLINAVDVAVAAGGDGSVFVAAQVSFSENPAVLNFDSSGAERWRYAYGQPGDYIQDMAYSDAYSAA